MGTALRQRFFAGEPEGFPGEYSFLSLPFFSDLG
jgi:hypothetical protein